jgi:hypothetical protein
MHIRIIVYFKMVFLHCDGRKKNALLWILYFFLNQISKTLFLGECDQPFGNEAITFFPFNFVMCPKWRFGHTTTLSNLG